MPPQAKKPAPLPGKPGGTTPPAEVEQEGIRSVPVDIQVRPGDVRRYHLDTLNAYEALQLAGEVGDLLAGPITAFVLLGAGVPGSPVAMMRAMEDLASKLAQESFRASVWRVLRGPLCNGREIDPVAHFVGKMHVLQRLLLHGLEINLGSFIDGVPPDQRARLYTAAARLISQAEKMASSSLSSEPVTPPSKTSEQSMTSAT